MEKLLIEQKKTFDYQDLPPQLFEFVENKNNNEPIIIDNEKILEYQNGWQDGIIDREKAFGALWEHQDWQNKHLLSRLQINQHAREHTNRVAGLTGLLYLALRGPQRLEKIKNTEQKSTLARESHRLIRSLLTVAEVSGQAHDCGYSAHLEGMSYADIKKILTSKEQRGVLPDHAEYSARLTKYALEPIYENPEEYQQLFREKYKNILLWKNNKYHGNLNQCVRAIEKHTSEQLKSPLTAQQTSGDLALLVFCADKLDFLSRAPKHFLKEKLFNIGPEVHQRLNLSVINQKILVDQNNKKVELRLTIDPDIPKKLAQEAEIDVEYGVDEYEKEFFQIYEKSFEEIDTIFKVLYTKEIAFNEENFKHSSFSVKLVFPDGSEKKRDFLGRTEEIKKENSANRLATRFNKKRKAS